MKFPALFAPKPKRSSTGAVDTSYVPDYLKMNGSFRNHHPVFTEFMPFESEVDVDIEVDYIGSLTRPEYLPAFNKRSNKLISASIPAVDEEYFEWIDILMAVKDAGRTFSAVELGAGYGRWGVRAGCAARKKGIENIHLTFAEAEPTHVRWLRQHVRDNGFSEYEVEILEGAISDRSGVTYFYTGMPEGYEHNSPREWYGQSIAQDHERPAKTEDQTPNKESASNVTFESGWRGIEVPLMDIIDVSSKWCQIDLLDLDVQGEEEKIIRRSIKDLNRGVKRLHIGTHSRKIEAGLRSVLAENGWICVRDFPTGSTTATPYGEVTFVDGVQSWINPKHQVTWA
ncbi:MAG: hypothetical protein H6905_11595 [Hyphomicrobiales bacterium]|nr:hypothetical protein [Hyphomicrobiales bacterium]